MKTYTAGTNLIMVEGEIAIIKSLPKDISDIDTKHIFFFDSDSMPKQILASTKQLEGIPLLDRSKFVKSIDVEELAIKHYPELYNHALQRKGFKAGYNANKAEFTELQLAKALRMAYDNGAKKEIGPAVSFYRILQHLKPITLPKSIECDDNYNIIKIKW